MAYKDALQDTVSIFSVTTDFKAGDSIGQQVKTETALYENVPGRLNSVVRTNAITFNAPGLQEKYSNSLILEMEPQYNGGNRGDRALVNGESFIISKKLAIKGRTPAVHHVAYYLEDVK